MFDNCPMAGYPCSLQPDRPTKTHSSDQLGRHNRTLPTETRGTPVAKTYFKLAIVAETTANPQIMSPFGQRKRDVGALKAAVIDSCY